jgi:hypothetical protein
MFRTGTHFRKGLGSVDARKTPLRPQSPRQKGTRTTSNLSARLEALVLSQQEPAFPGAASPAEVSN